MSKRNRPLTVVMVLTLLATLVLLTSRYKPSRAHLAAPQDGQVEVVQASAVATSTEPLRGTPPDLVSLDAVRKNERMRLNPNRLVILGPGTKDPVLQFAGGRTVEQMDKWMADLRGKVLIEGAGHWVQIERPAEVTEALIGFLKTVAG